MGKTSKQLYIGLKETILQIIYEEPNKLFTNPDGTTYQIQKKEKGRATTKEIIANLRKFNRQISKTTIYRALGDLAQGKIVQGEKRGIYQITEKGEKALERIRLILKGRGGLHKYAKDPVWIHMIANMVEGEVDSFDLHVRFFNREFIKELELLLRKNANIKLESAGVINGTNSTIIWKRKGDRRIASSVSHCNPLWPR